MFQDVVDLHQFYGTPQGKMARRVIRSRIREFWPNLSGLTVAGFGYPVPFLSLYRNEAKITAAFMPSYQGVVYWPFGGPGTSACVDEGELPLPDNSVDRFLLIHGLEATEKPRLMLREIWRVLADGGKVLVCATNRSGLWAHADTTPFGRGRPFSPSQLKTLLRDNMFMPERTSSALFAPPVESRMMISSAPAWEKFGRQFLEAVAGVTMVEASKQIYGTPLTPVKDTGRKATVIAFPGKTKT